LATNAARDGVLVASSVLGMRSAVIPVLDQRNKRLGSRSPSPVIAMRIVPSLSSVTKDCPGRNGQGSLFV
jgi:hypothetical protein